MIYEEPFASSALWARRLGFFAVPVLLVGWLVQRTGGVGLVPMAAVAAAVVILAVLAVLLALMAFASIWIKGRRGAWSATAGLFAGLLVLAGPAALAVVSWNLPFLTDISTDTQDPPRLVHLLSERSPDENAAAYPGPAAARQQAEAWPDIAPVRLAVSVDEAQALVMELVHQRRWRVVDDGGEGGPQRRIEAATFMPLLHLPEDVVIRIRSEDGGARVDMRSLSSFGQFDFGSNARRVRKFMADLSATAR